MHDSLSSIPRKRDIDKFEEASKAIAQYSREVSSAESRLTQARNELDEMARKLCGEARVDGPYYVKSSSGEVYLVSVNLVNKIELK